MSKNTSKSKRPATVQDLIDQLNALPDKSAPVSVWLNSMDPEPIYTSGCRLELVHVDQLTDGEKLTRVDLNAQPFGH